MFVLPLLHPESPRLPRVLRWLEAAFAILRPIVLAPSSRPGFFAARVLLSYIFSGPDTRARLSGVLYMMAVFHRAQQASDTAVLERFATYRMTAEDFRAAAERDQSSPVLREAFLAAIRHELTPFCTVVSRLHPDIAG